MNTVKKVMLWSINVNEFYKAIKTVTINTTLF